MKHILLLGAGKSSSVLIEYLLQNAEAESFQLTVADTEMHLAEKKIGNSPFGTAVQLDVKDEKERRQLIASTELVISLLPPNLHILVVMDCIQFKKSLLTASYINDEIRHLSHKIEQAGILVLCEMGLDPGIDHMSAMKIIDELKEKEGIITSFVSHCGGLVAPESDDNPWHYKISWNPRNIVNAGKDGALYKQNGKTVRLSYTDVFAEKRYLPIGDELFCWYPNRDSLHYTKIYGLENCHTFIRTTLRHPDFIYGWKNIVDLKLTDDTIIYNTDGKTINDLFKEHLDKHNFSDWLEKKLREQFKTTQELLSNLVSLTELEQKAQEEGNEGLENFMMVSERGDLENIDIDDLKNNAAATIAFKMHESKLTLSQLFYLGMNDDRTYLNKGRCSVADILQFLLENKLALREGDKDRVIMLHEIEYSIEGVPFVMRSLLNVKGEDKEHTAMAKTVGLPLGIAARLLLKGQINMTGLHIPNQKIIYEPILKELKACGIEFEEI